MTVRRSRISMLLLFLVSLGCSPEYPERTAWSLDELEIEVADTSREVSFSNTKAGFYYTESNAVHRNSWQGWHVSSVKLMADYLIDLGGRPLERRTADYSRVWPHELTRSYHEGVQETFTFLDSVDAFIITLENVRSITAGLSLAFDMSSRFDTAALIRDSIILCSPFSVQTRSDRPDVPGWIGFTTLGDPLSIADTMRKIDGRIIRGDVRQRVVDGRAGFIVAAGPTPEHVISTLRDLKNNPGRARNRRRARLEGLLNRTNVRTSDERFDKALAWATLSMDALIMEQGRKGIFAGLPWFSNYWGRDTFISLPGATIVSGRFEDAKEILLSFSLWQNTDRRSPDEGRVPNIVTPTSVAYNTTDGTPWFILGVYDYILASGDTAFGRDLYPVIRRANDGPMHHRLDGNGFLIHEDAETWMDAVGPEGPWSPRGNRAVDIQALWHRQLTVSASIASILGMSDDAERWSLAAEEVLFAFRDMFIDPADTLLYDHLNSDGTPDRSVRPNQLFALDMVGDGDLRAGIFRNLTRELVYEHGVGSLSPRDENFHPFHHVEPLYVQDAAYHNGIVWTWLNGPWIEHAVRFNKIGLANRVSSNMVHQILDRGAVGTMSELLDAAPRSGEVEPRLSGTFTQAWSLAEFLRTTYRSYFGVEVDAIDRQVWLRPRLPENLGAVSFSVFVGPTTLHVSYARSGKTGRIRLTTEGPNSSLSVSSSWVFSGGLERTVNVQIDGGHVIDVVITPDGALAEDELGNPLALDTQVRNLPHFNSLDGLTLATPLVRPDLKSMAGPDVNQIPHSDITSKTTDAVIRIDVDDPRGDDVGTGAYAYPSTTNLAPGSLDLIRFGMEASDTRVTFEMNFSTLSNPGWHPEYGFQLTYVAIAIDKDGVRGSGKNTVGRNALYSLPDGQGYETIVFVGGGIQVEDASGRILGAYIPSPGDETDPLGSASAGSIRFSLHTSLIGIPTEKWQYTLLVGAQDDHGGAGIGEFRSVNAEGGEWIGGGKQRPDEPNVYDVLRYP